MLQKIVQRTYIYKNNLYKANNEIPKEKHFPSKERQKIIYNLKLV